MAPGVSGRNSMANGIKAAIVRVTAIDTLCHP
jgi:hypothetical protein